MAEPDWQKLHPWFQQQRGGYVAVTIGSSKFHAWRDWFRRELQWTPAFMQRYSGEVTLPSQWPPNVS